LELYAISAVTGKGIEELKYAIAKAIVTYQSSVVSEDSEPSTAENSVRKSS
jgi:hypothetical protein